jgi:coenzyme F420-reducing hydrogenase beta subunit
MTDRDDILRMAREAGFKDHGNPELWDYMVVADEVIERFFKLAYEAGAAAERERIIAANAPEIERINAHIKELEQARAEEREACAKVCDPYTHGQWFADAIRARGNK